MSEPTVTSTSSTHSAPVSKATKPHPHSVAHEEHPPESRPVGSEEHGTTGPSDAPPGTKEGEQYPPQIHAGKVGYGPHYAEVHGKDTDDAKNPFKNKEEETGAQNPASTTENKDVVDTPKDSELKPGVNKTDTDGAPTVERIPSSTVASTTETRDTPNTKPHDIPTTKSHGAPTVTTEQDHEGAAIRH